MKKECNKCKIKKELEEFHRDRYKRDGRCTKCKKCVRKYHNKHREEIQEYMRNWSRSLEVKVSNTYKGMYKRVTGKGLERINHLYEGLPILPREEFIEWSLKDNDLKRLYEDWVASDYEPKLVPSIDRIDSTKGYTLDNMRWITHSENCRLGAISRWKAKK